MWLVSRIILWITFSAVVWSDHTTERISGVDEGTFNGIKWGRHSFEFGFEVDYEKDKKVDINECERGIDNCPEDKRCINDIGSFHCVKKCTEKMKYYHDGRCHPCRKGMHILNGKCVDLPDCQEKPDICRKYFERCESREGKWQCVHHCSGNLYERKGKCLVHNVCEEDIYPCESHQICQSFTGFYRCKDCKPNSHYSGYADVCECNKGFKQNRYMDCEDVDECSIDSTLCGVHGKCVNTLGHYSCKCDHGYTFNNSTCVDIDECSKVDNICKGLNCINTIGSFKCECETGYLRTESYRCIDVNECVQNPEICEENCSGKTSGRKCINLVGRHKCLDVTCPNNYIRSEISNGARCALQVVQCSHSDSWLCWITNALRRDRIVVELLLSHSVPVLVTSVPISIDGTVPFQELRSTVEMLHYRILSPTGIVLREMETKNSQRRFIITKNSDDSKINVFLNFEMAPSSELIFDLIVNARTRTGKQMVHNSRIHVFATLPNPFYIPSV